MPIYTRVPTNDRGHLLVSRDQKMAKLQELFASFKRAWLPRCPVQFVELAACQVRTDSIIALSLH